MSAGADPLRATFWLLEAPDSLSVQSHREPDGAGIGYFDAGGAPRVDKQPIAASVDPEFARAAREIESRTFVAHVRFASTGALKPSNTHPFCQRGRLFAHNGVIGDLPALEARLRSARLGDGLSLVGGDTDSERFFALLTCEIAARDGDVAGGIQAAVGWVSENLPVFSLNFVLTTVTDAWALRYPDAHGLFVLERAPGGGKGGNAPDRESALDHTSALGTRVHSEPASSRPVVVLASEKMDADPRWRPLASGELLHVSETLHVESAVIVDRPPAHQLTLADLEPGARTSQG